MIDTMPLIDSIDPDEANASEAAPRKRGRPRLTPEQKEARNAADRQRRAAGGAKRGRPRGRPSRTPKSLYPEIAASLTLVNTIVSMTPLGPKYEDTGATRRVVQEDDTVVDEPILRVVKIGDTLDEVEITQLAKALDTQCQRSPRFRRQVERILGASAGGQIFTVLGMIAVRRASRHGIAPAMLDPMIGAMLAGADLGALADFAPQPDPNAVDPETGERTPFPTPDLNADAQPSGVDFESLA